MKIFNTNRKWVNQILCVRNYKGYKIENSLTAPDETMAHIAYEDDDKDWDFNVNLIDPLTGYIVFQISDIQRTDIKKIVKARVLCMRVANNRLQSLKDLPDIAIMSKEAYIKGTKKQPDQRDFSWAWVAMILTLVLIHTMILVPRLPDGATFGF